MTSTTPSPAVPTMCARHPDVETGLACGRCETPICPRCLVYTAAGTRCPDCGRAPTLPIHQVGAGDTLRILGAAIPLAIMLGIAGALLFPPRVGGLLMILVGVAAGSGAGALMAAAIMRVSKKRGPRVIAIASGALLLMAIVRFVGGGGDSSSLLRDFGGVFLLLISVSTASNRLR